MLEILEKHYRCFTADLKSSNVSDDVFCNITIILLVDCEILFNVELLFQNENTEFL